MDNKKKFRTFPDSVPPQDLQRRTSGVPAKAPDNKNILVSVVADSEDDKTARKPSPLEAFQATVERESFEEAKTLTAGETQALKKGVREVPTLSAPENEGEGDADSDRTKFDSEPSLQGPTETELAHELAMSVDLSMLDEDETIEPGTVRHVPVTFSRGELRAIKRTLAHCARRESSLAIYLYQKAIKYGVPEDRARLLLRRLGF